MEKERPNDSVFSKKLRAGKRRTYFFDVRKTKADDYYISITESAKKHNEEGFERHKIFVYKEDFNRFIACMEEVVNEVKAKYLPDFDYDAYSKRDEEWENNKKENKEDSLSW